MDARHRLTAKAIRLVAVPVLVAFTAVVLSAANALAFHNYSVGTDNSWRTDNTYYSGVSVQRYDSTFTLSPAGSCSTSTAPGSGPVLYQTMWLPMDPSAQTWLEMGTGHKTCANGTEFKWWYIWMSNPNGFSGYLWTKQIFGSALHRFFISNGTDGYWRWVIDYELEYQYYWPNLGFYAQAGLESYDSTASAPSHDYNGMVIQHNWSAWTAWTPSVYTPGGTSCKTLVPPSDWCAFDADLGNVNVSGNYLSPNRGYASEP